MVRRTFWMLVGAGLGAWMVVKVQHAASHLTPTGALGAAQRHIRHLRNDVAAAVDEGRRAKRAAEQDLRQLARSRPAIDIAARPALTASSPPAPEARISPPAPEARISPPAPEARISAGGPADSGGGDPGPPIG